jgi:hypothetical protein
MFSIMETTNLKYKDKIKLKLTHIKKLRIILGKIWELSK